MAEFLLLLVLASMAAVTVYVAVVWLLNLCAEKWCIYKLRLKPTPDAAAKENE